MREVFQYLKKSHTFYLATCEDGQPRVRPFGAIDLFEDRIYIQTGKVKNVFKQMQKNPRVELCAMIDDSSWIRVEATVVRDERMSAKQHMLDENPILKSMYAADDGNHEVLYLKDATATIYSFTEKPRIIKF